MHGNSLGKIPGFPGKWEPCVMRIWERNKGAESRRYEVIALTTHFGFSDLLTLQLGQHHQM